MDPQSSGSKFPQLPPPPPEVHVNISSKDKATDGASQGYCEPTEGIPTVEVNEKYRPLILATMKGDWKSAKNILNEDLDAMTAEVMTFQSESVTVLDVAVMAAQDQLVKNLVKRLPKKSNVWIFRSALYNAARRGRISIIKALVENFDDEPESIDLALSYAIANAPMQKEVIWYLARHTKYAPKYLNMSALIMAGHLDIGLYLARQYEKLATSHDSIYRSSLADLAKTRSYFLSGARPNFWGKCISKCIPLCLVDASFYNSKDTKTARALQWFKISLWNLATKPAPFIKRIGESQLRHKRSLEFASLALSEMKKNMKTPEILKFLLKSGIVSDAASRGIIEIIELCLEHFPELIWCDNFIYDLMKEAVNGRRVELFRLVNACNRIPKLSDDIFTNRHLMEAVVCSPGCGPTDVSGAAFLLQRELQWFKELEERSDPSFKSLKFKVEEDRSDPSFKSLKLEEEKIGRGKTYWEIFVEQHQDLLKEAGQWMKNTSSSCSVIATLIITIAFAAAFTIPGGNDNMTGIPIFLKKGSFMLFAIADALALFSSITATLMFLAILTSRYAIDDFLHSLPRKMILGLTFLFLSLAFMLVAFGSALTIVLSKRLKWIYIPITLLAAFPIVLFAILQLPLYVEMVKSTYWPRLHVL